MAGLVRVRVGIASPIVTRFPGAYSEWEATGDIGDLAAIAATADRLGFDFLTCSEHVAVPAEVARVRGGTYWDPAVTLGFLAAHTNRIGLLTQVLVLGYHHPLEIAKRYGTLDRVSGGRLFLGVGVGSLAEEFELLGASFDDRGRRADESMAAIRSALRSSNAEYHGEFFDYADQVVDPGAVADHVPMWVGGQSARSLRRAVELGDGWIPFGRSLGELRSMLDAHELPPGFDVVLSVGAVDPQQSPDSVRDRFGRAIDAGATRVVAGVEASSADHYRDQLMALAQMWSLSDQT